MALPSNVEVVQGTIPRLEYKMTTFRDEARPSVTVDVAGYVFLLVVSKPRGDFEWFRLTGTVVDSAAGTLEFQLTTLQTNIPADDYDAEVRWWAPPDAPTATPTDALAGAGAGNVDNGLHSYVFSYVGPEGESDASPVSDGVTVADKTVNGKVSVAGIAVGPAGTTARKLYRTIAGDTGAYKLVATISDNVTTTYEDNIADGSLGAAHAAAADNTYTTRDAVAFSYKVSESNG